MSSILAKALKPVVKPVLKKMLTIAGKEISKKTVCIAGGIAGTAALAGGTTAAVVIHNKKKAKNETSAEETAEETVDENATKSEESTPSTSSSEDEQSKSQMEAPVEEAGAEKIENVNTTPQNAIPFPTNNAAQQQVPPFVNPAAPGPNPAFMFMAEHGMPDPNIMGQVYPMPQQEQPPIQTAPVENQEPAKEVEAEVLDKNGDAVEEDTNPNDIVYTAADAAQGKKPKKRNKKVTVVEIPTTDESK